VNQRERTKHGNRLKAHYNVLWDEAVRHDGALSYRDAVRIKEAIECDGPQVLGLSGIPSQIRFGLNLSVAAVNPNKARAQEDIKNALSAVTGAGGLALAAYSIGTLLSPGIWALVVTFVGGGVAGGPLAIIGVAGGILIVGAAAYAAFSNMTPKQRATKAHEYVTYGIDAWIKEGDASVESAAASDLPEEISISDLPHAASLMLEVASADRSMSPEEREVRDARVGNRRRSAAGFDGAIAHFQTRPKSTRRTIFAWCQEMARAEEGIGEEEKQVLSDIRTGLGLS